jgi:hypothetical protein
MTLTLHHVQRCHMEHDAQSESPAKHQLRKQKEGEGQLFRTQPPKKEGKSGSSSFPARTIKTKTLHKIFITCFLINMKLCILFFLPFFFQNIKSV